MYSHCLLIYWIRIHYLGIAESPQNSGWNEIWVYLSFTWSPWAERKRLAEQLDSMWLFRHQACSILLLVCHSRVITVNSWIWVIATCTRCWNPWEGKRTDRARTSSLKWSCTLHLLSASCLVLSSRKAENCNPYKGRVCPVENWWGNFLTKRRERMNFRGHCAIRSNLRTDTASVLYYNPSIYHSPCL